MNVWSKLLSSFPSEFDGFLLGLRGSSLDSFQMSKHCVAVDPARAARDEKRSIIV